MEHGIAESLIFLFCSSEFSFLPSGVDIMLGRFSGLNWKLSGAKEAVPKDPKQCQYRIQGVSEILGSVWQELRRQFPENIDSISKEAKEVVLTVQVQEQRSQFSENLKYVQNQRRQFSRGFTIQVQIRGDSPQRTFIILCARAKKQFSEKPERKEQK